MTITDWEVTSSGWILGLCGSCRRLPRFLLAWSWTYVRCPHCGVVLTVGLS